MGQARLMAADRSHSRAAVQRGALAVLAAALAARPAAGACQWKLSSAMRGCGLNSDGVSPLAVSRAALLSDCLRQCEAAPGYCGAVSFEQAPRPGDSGRCALFAVDCRHPQQARAEAWAMDCSAQQPQQQQGGVATLCGCSEAVPPAASAVCRKRVADEEGDAYSCTPRSVARSGAAQCANGYALPCAAPAALAALMEAPPQRVTDELPAVKNAVTAVLQHELPASAGAVDVQPLWVCPAAACSGGCPDTAQGSLRGPST
eukprot:TRINITY_DN27068_c0_g2_i1.p2 TRINITY_DN27068_c0_g2~~TRINITY_DN27068_c0_g2_i1.p2  ORF type:complete len:292 (+),score=55.25 TRINITY_DN27068_c0_g2_i1:98-877(+)